MIKINKKQLKLLEGLAYWIADTNYIKERYGSNDPELKKCNDTIIDLFDDLDGAGVPFMVQNNIICWAEIWRNYKKEHTSDFLKRKGYILLNE